MLDNHYLNTSLHSFYTNVYIKFMRSDVENR